MKPGWIFKDSQIIELPSLTAVIEKEGNWYVSKCPELGVASQGKTSKEAYSMLAEAVELWLEAASAKEIIRRLKGRSHLILLATAPLPDDPGTVVPVSFKVAHEIQVPEADPKLAGLKACPRGLRAKMERLKNY